MKIMVDIQELSSLETQVNENFSSLINTNINRLKLILIIAVYWRIWNCERDKIVSRNFLSEGECIFCLLIL